MIRIPAATLVLFAASQAAALTCVPADPITTFRLAQEAPESYVVLHGRLNFDPSVMPSGTENVPPSATETRLEPVPAQFEGFALSPEGFTRPVQADILLQPVCFSQWCGSIGPGEDWLLFAQLTGADAYRVEVNPCSVWTFQGVPQATREALAGCFQGERCGV